MASIRIESNAVSKIQKKCEDLLKKEPEHLDDTSDFESNFLKFVQKEMDFRALYLQLKSLHSLLQKQHINDKESIATIEKNITQMKQGMRKYSDKIILQLNKKYHANWTFEEVLQKKDGFYYQNGIMNTIQKNGLLLEVFRKELEQILPNHPMDEYPQARKMKRKFIIHSGPTNSGKTHESMQAFKAATKAIYLAPLRLLALEIFDRCKEEGVACNLLTGEEEIFHESITHTSCTIEKASLQQCYDVAVIDEAQMIADAYRGDAWTAAILGLQASEIHVCCAPHALPLIQKMIEECRDDCTVVHHERSTPLVVEQNKFQFPNDVVKGDALIVFSRKAALQVASALDESGFSSSVIYGNLPPETRKKQVQQFIEGKTDVVVSTDAIGMGLNLPIRRIIFLELEKFDGEKKRALKQQEIKQIAGRAGRKGMYDIGYIGFVSGRKMIERSLESDDEPLKKALLSPSKETILSLPFGDLQERLRAWFDYTLTIPHFKKSEINKELELINAVPEFSDVLSVKDLYQAIRIPFNAQDPELFELWYSYVQALIKKAGALAPPKMFNHDLYGLELYYKKINLYYSFSKAFSLHFENDWVNQEREKTADEIHRFLRTKIQSFQRKCNRCGRKLAWNHLFRICDHCYRDDYMYDMD